MHTAGTHAQRHTRAHRQADTHAHRHTQRAYICTHSHMHTHTHTHTHIQIQAHAHRHTLTHAHKHAQRQAHTHTHTHTHTHRPKHTQRACICTHVHTQPHALACTLTHTHTHIHTLARLHMDRHCPTAPLSISHVTERSKSSQTIFGSKDVKVLHILSPWSHYFSLFVVLCSSVFNSNPSAFHSQPSNWVVLLQYTIFHLCKIIPQPIQSWIIYSVILYSILLNVWMLNTAKSFLFLWNQNNNSNNCTKLNSCFKLAVSVLGDLIEAWLEWILRLTDMKALLSYLLFIAGMQITFVWLSIEKVSNSMASLIPQFINL